MFRFFLDDEKNNFEKGQIDVFKVIIYRQSCWFVILVKFSNLYNNVYFLFVYFLDL